MKWFHRVVAVSLLTLALLLPSLNLVAAQNTNCETGFRAVAHTLGASCVSENPQRVVVLEWTYLEDLLAVGIQPVGVADIEGYNEWVKIPLALDESVVDVGTRNEPNLEVIAGLNPDLIIGVNFRLTENYDDLSAIAPTLAFNPYPDDLSVSQYDEMLTTFTIIADLLNRKAEGEAVLATMQDHFAAAQAALEAAGRGGEDFILSQGWTYDSVATFRLFTDNAMAVQVLSQIGLNNAWDDAPQLYGFTEIGIEGFSELSEDEFSFFYVAQDSDNEFFAESPLWSNLGFVKAERAYWMGGDVWLFGGPLSAQLLVDTTLQNMGIELPTAETVAATVTECEAGFHLFDHERLATDPVCIPDNAQRIISLDMPATEFLLLNDIPIVGVFGYAAEEIAAVTPGLADDLEGIPTFSWPPSLELITELNPDLIIAFKDSSLFYSGMDQIAPLVVYDAAYATDWKSSTSFWSQVFQKEDAYDDMLATYDARVAELGEAIGEDRGDIKVSAFVPSDTYPMIWLVDSAQGVVLNDVGLGRSDAQAVTFAEGGYAEGGADYGFVAISNEALDLADGDVIFLFTWASLDPATAEANQTYLEDFNENNALWNSLPGVKEGNVFIVGPHWFRAQTYLAANLIIDDLFTYIAATEPTTPSPAAEFMIAAEVAS